MNYNSSISVAFLRYLKELSTYGGVPSENIATGKGLSLHWRNKSRTFAYMLDDDRSQK